MQEITSLTALKKVIFQKDGKIKFLRIFVNYVKKYAVFQKTETDYGLIPTYKPQSNLECNLMDRYMYVIPRRFQNDYLKRRFTLHL